MAGAYHNSDATVSARRAATVTPSDATIIPTTRGLYVGTGGNLTVIMAEDGLPQLFTNVASGVFPVQVIQVMATGTTASNIVALW